MIDSRVLTQSFVEDMRIAALAPWPCPCDFGPAGRYRLEEVVGIGSSSVVYAATDGRLSMSGYPARVAIKMSRLWAGLQEIHLEAKTIRRVRHPNVVAVHDVGRLDDGTEYVVQELVEGCTLANEPVPARAARAARLIVKIARGIQAAHRAGVFHCDLKPSNILMTAEGEPKISDFGFASRTGEAAGPTRGNFAFMAPEQFRGEPGSLSAAADIYAIGGLLYYLLSAQTPHGNTIKEAQRRLREASGLSWSETGTDVAGIIRKATDPDPAARYESAGALADDLERWLGRHPLPWTQRPRRVALWCRRNAVITGIAVTTMTALAVGQWQFSRMDRTALRREAAALNRGLDHAKVELNRTREMARAVVRTTAAQVIGQGAEEHLSELAWLEWTYGHRLIGLGTEGRMIRLEAIRGILATAAEEERYDLEYLIAAKLVAAANIRDGNRAALDEAKAILAKMDQVGGEVVSRSDRWWTTVRVLDRCAAALDLVEQGGFDRADHELDEARRIIAEVSLEDPIHKLLRQTTSRCVAARIKQQPVPTSP